MLDWIIENKKCLFSGLAVAVLVSVIGLFWLKGSNLPSSNKAMTLYNQANLHRNTKEYGLAQAEYEEALKLYRGLAEADPKIFLPNLAMALNNLAILHQTLKPLPTEVGRFVI